MPTLKVEQYKKWSSVLPEGWKFDAQRYVMWGEKEIYTDSAENEKGVFYRLTLEYRAETENAGYFRRETGRQIPAVSISRYTPTGSGMFSVVHILTENAADPESKRNYNALVKLAATIDSAEYFKRAAEKDTGKQYNDFSDFAGIIEDAAEDNDSAAENLAQEPETEEAEQNNAEEENATEAQESAENVTIAEPEAACVWDENGDEIKADTVTETAPEESAQEEAQETEAEQEEDAPDMFATLAAAYFAGKTVKSKPRKVEQKQGKPAEPETVEPEPEPEPEPIIPGYHENQNDRFTEDERKALSAGLNVIKKDKYNYTVIYFSAPYFQNVRLVYSVRYFGNIERISPESEPSASGFLVNTDFYSAYGEIEKKLKQDINAKLFELVPNEETAAALAAEDDYIQRIRDCTYKMDAQELFFEGKKPSIYLCEINSFLKDELIQYVIEPETVIQEQADAYIKSRANSILALWIQYNKTSAEYDEIVSNPDNDEHKRKRIASAITEQKTVKVELSNGHEVKVEADAVKRITFCGDIPSYYVAAQDRQYLNKNQYGRAEDIQPDEIKRITHGGRVLYSA